MDDFSVEKPDIESNLRALLFEREADIERLQAALARYGDHEYECALKNGEGCSCGYEAALEQIASLQASSGYEISIAQLKIERLTAERDLWKERTEEGSRIIMANVAAVERLRAALQKIADDCLDDPWWNAKNVARIALAGRSDEAAS